MADNLQKREWQNTPTQDYCALCNEPLETGIHLSLLCPFARAVWGEVLSWENLNVQLPHQDTTSMSDGMKQQERCQSKSAGVSMAY